MKNQIRVLPEAEVQALKCRIGSTFTQEEIRKRMAGKCYGRERNIKTSKQRSQ